MDNLKQPDQGLSSNCWASWHYTQDLGQECHDVERKDHSDPTRSSGKGLCEGPSGTIEAPQRGVHDCQHFLCEQDSVLPNVESQDMFYGNQSPPGQSYSTNIHGIQGDLPVLSPLQLLHYKGTCGWGNCTPQDSDWIPTRWTTGQSSQPQ